MWDFRDLTPRISIPRLKFGSGAPRLQGGAVRTQLLAHRPLRTLVWDPEKALASLGATPIEGASQGPPSARGWGGPRESSIQQVIYYVGKSVTFVYYWETMGVAQEGSSPAPSLPGRGGGGAAESRRSQTASRMSGFGFWEVAEVGPHGQSFAVHSRGSDPEVCPRPSRCESFGRRLLACVSLWAREFHPLRLRLRSSQTLRDPES